MVQKCEAGRQKYSSSCIPESKLIFLFSSVYNPTTMSRTDILNRQTDVDEIIETSWPFCFCRATAALNLGWGSGRVTSVLSLHIYFPCSLNFQIQNTTILSKRDLFPTFLIFQDGNGSRKDNNFVNLQKSVSGDVRFSPFLMTHLEEVSFQLLSLYRSLYCPDTITSSSWGATLGKDGPSSTDIIETLSFHLCEALGPQVGLEWAECTLSTFHTVKNKLWFICQWGS